MSIQLTAGETRAEIQSKLGEMTTKLEAKKQELKKYRARLKIQVEEKESEVK